MNNRTHPRHDCAEYVRGYLHRQANVYCLQGKSLFPTNAHMVIFMNTRIWRMRLTLGESSNHWAIAMSLQPKAVSIRAMV